MILTEEDQKMYDGRYGAGTQRAMALLVRLGEAVGAEKLVPITSSHITIEGPYAFLTEMTEDAQARTYVTLHTPMEDPRPLKELGIATDVDVDMLIERYINRIDVARRMGFVQTFTCTPYIGGDNPKKGDIAVWLGVSGQATANSWYGVRMERQGANAALASAVTGRTPYFGQLQPENRYGKVLVEFDNVDVERLTEAHYGALGYYLGAIAGERNIAIDGLPPNLYLEKCKNLFAGLAATGAVSLCHIVGVTPEASTVEQALGNKKPEEKVVVQRRDLEEAWQRLNSAGGGEVDLVFFGCPHCSIREVREIASLLEGKRVHESARLYVGVSDATRGIAERMGLTDVIKEAGGAIGNSCAGVGNPFLVFGRGVTTVATNSVLAASLIPGVMDVKVLYGDLRGCIESAITGIWRG